MRIRSAAFAAVCVLGVFVGVPTAGAQTTALFFDSQPGEPVGRGVQHTWTDSDLVFTPTSGYSGPRVRITADSPDPRATPYWWWDLEFKAANGANLAPGTYEYAGDAVHVPSTRAGLDISGTGVGCDASGRFVIYEISFTSGGQLQSFAADFEQHCSDRIPALLGAIRYHSTRSSLVPFDGAPPVYSLHFTPSPFGRVTGGGLDCGNGGTVCDTTYDAADTVTLTATPAPGYQFLAWTLDCGGLLRETSLVVSRRKQCAATFDAAPGSGMPPPFSGNTLLFVDRDADGLYPASRWIWQPSDAQYEVFGSPAGVYFRIRTYDSDFVTVELRAPVGQALAPGVYERAGFSPSPVAPSFSFASRATGCSTYPRFEIYEIAFDTAGHLTRFSADFETHCYYFNTSGVFGAIRYNATHTAVVPFDGLYPVYSLAIDPPADGGAVSAPGIDCGSGGGDCRQTYTSPGPITVTAVPAPGHVFLGWTGDCGGTTSTSLLVMSRHRCGAVFDNAPDATGPMADDLRWGSFYLFGQRGDLVSDGTRRVWTRKDTAFEVTPLFSSDPRRGPSFRVDDTWKIAFAAPKGQVLGVGDYTFSGRFPFLSTDTNGGLSVSGLFGCGTATGRVRIYEMQLDSAGLVTSFAADFEQRCDLATASLFGAIRYNSTRASVLPFDGDFLPRPDMTLEAPLDGSTVAPTFTVSGWALNTGEISGTGVDTVHVYAFPLPGGDPIFLGVVTYGARRDDLAARFGAQFRNSGFSLTTGPALPVGRYMLAAIAHDTVTGAFSTVRTAMITVAVPLSNPRMAIEKPAEGAAVIGAFSLDGWAIDAGAFSGTGVDAIHVYAFKAGDSTPIFLGIAGYGIARPDLAAIYGPRFANSGYHLNVSGLSSGSYLIWVGAHSTVSGQFAGTTRTITVTSTAMAIDTPGEGRHVTGSFPISGWAFDAAAPSGAGVDAVHVWALPANGGAPVFLGAGELNWSRPDVAAIYGARFANAGYGLMAPALAPGTYTIAVFAHSAATGTFNQMKIVTVVVD